jgi:hypothetical protein
MSKQKYIKVPLPKLNWNSWQITRLVVLVILAFRIGQNDELVKFLKALLKIWSG